MTKQRSVKVTGSAPDYPAGHVIEVHRHDAHQIIHAVHGGMRISADNKVWIVPPGRALWMPAQVEHEIKSIGPLALRTVYLEGSKQNFPDTVQVAPVSPFLRELMVKLSEGVRPEQLEPMTILLIEEIKDMVFDPLHLPLPKDGPLNELVHRLIEDPADQKRVPEWADELNMSARTLMRRVQSETGLSFRELKRQVRILSAIELLSLGHPVTTVAYEVGFESPSAFIHSFRTVTGKTPAHFVG